MAPHTPPDTNQVKSQETFLTARSAHLAGNLDLAEAGYRQAVTMDPANADAIHLLGVLLAQQGQPQDAEKLIRTALGIKEVWAYHDNLGKILRGQNRAAEARDAFLRAVELKQDHAEGLNAAAFLSLDMGDLQQAEILLRRILAQWPNQPVILNNLGNVLVELERHQEAETAYRDALALEPGYAVAHYNLGNLLSTMMRTEDAIQAYRDATHVKPDYFEAFNNLGNIYLDLKQFAEAERAYLDALALEPTQIDIVSNLGNLYSEQKRYQDAERYYTQAMSLNPALAHPRILLSYCKRQMCAWDGIDELNKSILDTLSRDTEEVLEPLQLYSEPGVTPVMLRSVGNKKILKDFGGILARPPLVPGDAAILKPRLRIGYLSADFHDHATMHLMLGVLEQRNRALFETYLYSFGPPVEDASRQRARLACERFVDIRSLSDQEAAASIARDGIDILVELKGYTTDSRLGIAAWHPAPVTVSWLGYPGTLGHPRIADYLLGDPIVTPLTNQSHFSETLALMPHCYQPTDSERPIGRKPTRAKEKLPEDAFVFCSFNGAFKINRETFDVWCRLLHAVPHSVLWLLSHSPAVQSNLRKEALARDIASERLVFAEWASQADHLGRLQLADLALDTYPYGSHTTGSDALWAEVPLISCKGETFASRVSASLLHAINLPDLVADNWEDYYTKALRLATSPNDLQEVKSRLNRNRLSAPLFDTARFTRDLERMYQKIWQHAVLRIRQPIILEP